MFVIFLFINFIMEIGELFDQVSEGLLEVKKAQFALETKSPIKHFSRAKESLKTICEDFDELRGQLR